MSNEIELHTETIISDERATGMAVQRLLIQEFNVSFETSLEIAHKILAITGWEDEPSTRIDSDRAKIIAEGVRLGKETRQRGISLNPSPSEVTALACVYFHEELKRVQTVIRISRAEMDLGILATQQLAAARAELTDKTAALRAIDRETSVRHIDAKVAEARETERAFIATELTALRASCTQLRSENSELRASKKKLREALVRAKEKK